MEMARLECGCTRPHPVPNVCLTSPSIRFVCYTQYLTDRGSWAARDGVPGAPSLGGQQSRGVGGSTGGDAAASASGAMSRIATTHSSTTPGGSELLRTRPDASATESRSTLSALTRPAAAASLAAPGGAGRGAGGRGDGATGRANPPLPVVVAGSARAQTSAAGGPTARGSVGGGAVQYAAGSLQRGVPEADGLRQGDLRQGKTADQGGQRTGDDKREVVLPTFLASFCRMGPTS